MTRNQRNVLRYIETVPTNAEPRTYVVRLVIGCQSFTVTPQDVSKEEAMWFRRQLAYALDNLIEENQP